MSQKRILKEILLDRKKKKPSSVSWNGTTTTRTLAISTALAILAIAFVGPADAFGDGYPCSTPLGMQDGRIADSALNVSSYWVRGVEAVHSRLNRDEKGGAWCPKEPIAHGVREWLEVSFNETQLISGVQLQGRFARGSGQEYAEKIQLEYWRDGFDVWRRYYSFDGKTILPGNTDTSTVVTNTLRPPIIAKKVRILPYSSHRRTICLRIELLGCIWENPVVQYSMDQGNIFLDGVSLRDETYDGQGSKWDRRVLPEQEVQPVESENKNNEVSIFGQEEDAAADDAGRGASEDEGFGGDTGVAARGSTAATTSATEEETYLTGGLGQLMDKIEGANLFTMDMGGYGLGNNGWVGWKRKKKAGVEEWVEVLFEFPQPTRFYSMNIYTNNYPAKGVEVFSRIRALFSNEVGGQLNGKPLTWTANAADVTSFEEYFARNISVPLRGRVGRFLRLQMFFKAEWIVVGEVYFSSEIYDGNTTIVELEADAQVDFPETKFPLEVGTSNSNSSSVETVVGIVCGLTLLTALLAALVVWGRRNGHSIASSFTSFHPNSFSFWRNTWSSVPRHIVTQSSNGTEGVKDLLLTLTPLSNGGNHHNGGSNGHATVVVMNGDFKAPHPPPPAYSINNGGAANGLQGSHYTNYGSTKLNNPGQNITAAHYNGSKLDLVNGINKAGYMTTRHQQHSSSTSASTLNLRSNQLAALDDEREGILGPAAAIYNGLTGSDYDYDLEATEDQDSVGGLYHETTAIGVNGNSSLKTRERKSKIAPRVWSLSCGGRSYRNHRSRLPSEVSLRQLRLVENLGSCLYGQVHLYDFEGEIPCHEGTVYRNCRLIAKTIKSLSEIRLLSVLDHEHVLAMIGVCSEMKKPMLALFPAPECGDLCSFLSRLSNTPSLSWLLNVGAQIASGMNYLESLSLIHRDLAARNCLVEREGQIRIADLAMACEQYRGDYCHTSRGLAPLRWWSWESILTDDFTMPSSVWSFGVTLWEIMTLCRQKPLAHVPDHQMEMLAEKYGSTATNQQTWLPQPLLSPPEIFDLMRECWQKNPTDRPTFQHIHLFLEQKCANTAVYHHVV